MSRTDRLRLILDVISTAALVVVCSLLLWRQSNDIGQGMPGPVGEAMGPVDTVALQTTLPRIIEGATSAPLALIEFADFECPFCAEFARNTYPQLKRDFIETGKLRYGFRHYPLEAIHRSALKAGTALECAGAQQQYWNMHSRLFQEPQLLTERYLVEHARALKLNESDFANCLSSAPVTIAEDQAEARRLGVRSTPTFLVGTVQADGKLDVVRRIQGAAPYEVFRSMLKSLSAR